MLTVGINAFGQKIFTQQKILLNIIKKVLNIVNIVNIVNTRQKLTSIPTHNLFPSMSSIPFVKIIGDKLALCDDKSALPETDAIRVLTIIGKARMGKSTFLNAIASHIQRTNIKPFATQDDDEHCTRGIDAFYCKDQQILLLDCQGLALEDSSHDPALLLFAYLVSDMIVFNERMMLQNEALKLLEPVCTFMTYLSLDIKKPQLFFRISDGDIVKDVAKNLDKVIRKQYKDQYQSIRDSIQTLFHANIGIVKTNSFDVDARALVSADDYLGLMSKTAVGFGAAIDTILAAIPDGRTEWCARIPHLIQQINLNEKITIDKLEVVRTTANLEIIEWISAIPSALFAELPADGLQTTMVTHIQPRQKETSRVLMEFNQKFAIVSETIKREHYDKLARRLAEPIQLAMDRMEACVQKICEADWAAATAERVMVYSNLDCSFASRNHDYWNWSMITKLRTTIAPLFVESPTRKAAVEFLKQFNVKLRDAIQSVWEMEKQNELLISNGIENVQTRILNLPLLGGTEFPLFRLNNTTVQSQIEKYTSARTRTLREPNILFVPSKEYVDMLIKLQVEKITKCAANDYEHVPGAIELKLTLRDKQLCAEFHTNTATKSAIAAAIIEREKKASLYFMEPLPPALVKQHLALIVNRLNSQTVHALMCNALERRKMELLFGVGISIDQYDEISVTCGLVHVKCESLKMEYYATRDTVRACILPVMNEVLHQMEQDELIYVKEDVVSLSFDEDESFVIDYVDGADNPLPEVNYVFMNLYMRAIAIERVRRLKGLPSRFVMICSDISTSLPKPLHVPDSSMLPPQLPLTQLSTLSPFFDEYEKIDG